MAPVRNTLSVMAVLVLRTRPKLILTPLGFNSGLNGWFPLRFLFELDIYTGGVGDRFSRPQTLEAPRLCVAAYQWKSFGKRPQSYRSL